MLGNYNKYKVLKVFLDSSTESFRLRELSRLSKLAPVSVISYLKEFQSQNLIKKYEKRKIPFYQANRDSEDFKLYQKISIQYELHKSGIIDFLWENLSPEVIILFGSHARGEAVEESDVDLFIIGKEKNINIENFEKKLNKKIHLLFNSEQKTIPNELKNNLINGIILKGYFKVF